MEAEKRETAMGAPFTQRASEGTAAAARASAARSGFTGTYCGADEVEQFARVKEFLFVKNPRITSMAPRLFGG